MPLLGGEFFSPIACPSCYSLPTPIHWLALIPKAPTLNTMLPSILWIPPTIFLYCRQPMTTVTPLISWRAELWLTAALSNTSSVIIRGDFNIHTDDPLNTLGLTVHWLLLFSIHLISESLQGSYPEQVITENCNLSIILFQVSYSSTTSANLSILFSLVSEG